MKKWTIIFIVSTVTILLVIGGLMYTFDPYFHFHKPIDGVAYSLGNYVYQNDGISKNFEYDAIITGTSMTQHLSTKQVDELFEVNSIRLTFLGEGFRRINDNLETALNSKNDVKLVIRGVDPIWFVCGEDFLGYGTYDAYPTYLYDNDWRNDFRYLYNWDVIQYDLIPTIVRSIRGERNAEFDDIIDYSVCGSLTKVKEAYHREPKQNLGVVSEETEEMMCNLANNIEQNLIKTIRENPETKFVLFFPPYGLNFWDELMQTGPEILSRRLDMEEYVIEQLLLYDNVELYSFLDCYDITTDLNNYTDDLHYTPNISRYIIDCIAGGEHMLTKENYKTYLEENRNFYMNFNYDAVFEKF